MRYIYAFLLIAVSLICAQEIAITTASSGQFSPDVASDGTKYFVVWEDTRSGTGNPNIYSRVVDGDGSLPGFEWPIRAVAGYQRIPAVGFIDEQYVCTWMDQVSGYAIDAKLVDTSGTPTILAYDIADAGGMIQKINVADNTGSALVVWEERISGRSVSRACVTNESEDVTLAINLSGSDGNQKTPSAAPYVGGWVVVFEDSTSSGKGIYAVKVTSSGSLDGSPYILAYGHSEANPSIATSGAGYIVVFDRDGATTGKDIFGLRLDASGSITGSTFPISTQTGDQKVPKAVFDGVGFLVVWHDTRDIMGDIYGQRVTISGTISGTEIVVCDSTGSQQKPSVASNGTNILVAWEDIRGATPDIYGIILPQMTSSSAPEEVVLQPLPLLVTACSRFPVEMEISDPDGIDLYSIIFTAQGDTFTPYSTALMLSGDTLRFSPPTDWPSGDTIHVCLEDIADSLGNHLESPICWIFFADLDEPISSNEIPRDGQIVDSLPDYVSINLSDSLSGICAGSIEFIFDADTFPAGSPEITWDGYTARLYPDPPAETLGTHTVTVFAGDLPDYCDANVVEYGWDFFVNPGSSPNASAIIPHSGDVTSNPLQTVQIKIEDDDGIDYASIELSHAGTVYSWPTGMSFIDSILTFTPTVPSDHGDEVNILLLSAMDSLGTDIESPLAYSFFVDLEPPEILDHFPSDGATLLLGTDDIWVYAQDNPAGVVGDDDHADFVFYDLSMLLIEDPTSGITEHSDTVVLQNGAFGGSLADDIDVNVCLDLSDDVDLGDPNDTVFCWQIHIQHTGITEPARPTEPGITVYPNPFNAACRIIASEAVDVYDLSGRKIWSSGNPKGATGLLWKPDGKLPAGLYLVRLRDESVTVGVLLLK